MEWEEKPCSECGRTFKPDGGRRQTCPVCRGVEAPAVGQGFLDAWNKKKKQGLWSHQEQQKEKTVAAIAVAVDTAEDEKAENNDDSEEIVYGGRAVTHKTCIDCRRVPEGEICRDRCLK